jgi:hypothetical protein
MGGPGSGRRPTALSVEDCRVLDIGELCDGGALHRTPRGQIIWQSELWQQEVALLSYALVHERWPDRESRLLLNYVYWPAADAPACDDEVELMVRRGVCASALCPACGRVARKLYAPPAAIDFSCRVCQGLSYPPSAKMRWRREMQERLAPLAAELREAREGRGPLPAKERLSPILEPQESRLACLRLHTAGLSLREITAWIGISKSHVHRLLAQDPETIDLFALSFERRWRGLVAGSIGRGRHRRGATQFETRELVREGADEESREVLSCIADNERCFALLREEGEQQLCLEIQALAKKRQRR